MLHHDYARLGRSSLRILHGRHLHKLLQVLEAPSALLSHLRFLLRRLKQMAICIADFLTLHPLVLSDVPVDVDRRGVGFALKLHSFHCQRIYFFAGVAHFGANVGLKGRDPWLLLCTDEAHCAGLRGFW